MNKYLAIAYRISGLVTLATTLSANMIYILTEFKNKNMEDEIVRNAHYNLLVSPLNEMQGIIELIRKDLEK